MRFGILTVSTSCFQNPEKDLAGPKLEDEIKRTFPNGEITFKQIVTDDKEIIIHSLKHAAEMSVCDVMFTVGGTGFSPDDVTPEATKTVIDKDAPGLVHALISRSLAVTEMAMLSRPVCGIKNKTIIINLPGSPKAAVECLGFIKNSLLHAVALLSEQHYKVKRDHEQIQRELSFNGSGDSKVKIKAGAARLRKSPFPMLEVEDAKDLIFKTVPALEEIEEIPIANALGRILAEDIRAPNPVPAFPASIKDGYAVKASDGAGKRTVRSVTAAGDAPDCTDLQYGEVIRISTGAAIPAGADAVVQVEDTSLVEVSENGEEEKTINISVAPKVGQDIRQIGSDIQANALVLQKHNPVSSAYIGVLAMLGIPKVKVIKRPSIGVVSTGNELVGVKETLQPGLVYDSNKITLLTLLKCYGYDAWDCGIARDRPNSIKTLLEEAFEKSDIIVSSGGVSMSEFDLMKQVLVEDFDATIHFGRLNMKPGKPTVFATLNYKGKTKLVFALPGNPVSCCVTSLLFVIPTLKYMENNKAFKGWPTVKVILDHDISNGDSRPEYVRLTISRDNINQLTAKSTGNQISSRLNSMVDANGLLLVPGKAQLKQGSCVATYLFGQLF